MNAKLKRAIFTPFSILYRINPEFKQKLIYRLKVKKRLDLNNVQLYREKLAYMKLYYRNDLMPKLADKYHAREYISAAGYGDHLPNLYWNGFDANEIPWDKLPNRFVAKTSHGSGYILVCMDKTQFDKEDAVKKLNKWLKEKYLVAYGEWFYGLVKPRIIIEEYLDNGTGTVPPDYKMFCFNGYRNNSYVALTAVDEKQICKTY